MSTATRPTSKHPRNSQFASVWLEFPGSMNLAITLLVAIAVASVVGTVLQQNQAYQDYVIKFGPFWFAVFDRPGLFNVYGAGWFMLILTFLVVSTSVCIYRTRVQRQSLEAFHQRRDDRWRRSLSGICIFR